MLSYIMHDTLTRELLNNALVVFFFSHLKKMLATEVRYEKRQLDA